MAKRNIEKGLGRGLDALLGTPEVQTAQSSGNSILLPISQVEPGLNQPRKRFEPEALAELCESIQTHGIIQPLTVRRLSSGYYQIIAGERRWRAAKMAGLNEVPAMIIEADDRKVMELGLIENLQREDLNPVEEAKGYQVLMKEYGLTQDEVAQQMGKSRPAIANTLRLLALPEAVLILLEEGSLSAGHARAILAAPNEELQIQAAQMTATQNLSVRQTEALVKTLQKSLVEKPAKPTPANDIRIYLADVEKSLASRFGRKVRVVDKGKKGRIELEYYDTDDLNALLDLLEQVKGGAGK
ncbi:MAG: ParB/RepB/Spo0J family partition protein [Oscillospiraceae bacterium]|nr:ParB/RepB/Spo0J family partition protein [Oscillospiraceae bacterium]